MKVELIASLIFALVGVGMITGGVYRIFDTKRFLAHAHEVKGVVVDRSVSRPRIGEKGLTLSAPMVEYRDTNGVAQIYQPSTRDSYSNFPIGQSITLFVQDAADGSPHSVRLATTQDLWVGSAILVIMGTGFTGFGAFAVIILWPPAMRPTRGKRRKTRSVRPPRG